jgi:precorrin-6B methylase 2
MFMVHSRSQKVVKAMKLLIPYNDTRVGVMIGDAKNALHTATEVNAARGGPKWRKQVEAYETYNRLLNEIGRLIVAYAVVDEYDPRQSILEEFNYETSTNEPK